MTREDFSRKMRVTEYEYILLFQRHVVGILAKSFFLHEKNKDTSVPSNGKISSRGRIETDLTKFHFIKYWTIHCSLVQYFSF